jgi:hypothetical protein
MTQKRNKAKKLKEWLRRKCKIKKDKHRMRSDVDVRLLN